jgi:hypothetical protein
MKQVIFTLFMGIIACETLAQTYGIWSVNSEPSTYNDVRGSLVEVNWNVLEPDRNNFKWKRLDKALVKSDADKIILLIYLWAQGNGSLAVAAPDWTSTIKICNCNSPYDSLNKAPDYSDETFKKDFKQMISQLKERIIYVQSLKTTTDINEDGTIDQADADIIDMYKKIVAVQACLGSTGDYPNYKDYCDSKGVKLQDPSDSYFYEMSQYFDQTYSSTSIHVIYNPGNNNFEELQWVLGVKSSNNKKYTSPAHPWLKMGDVGHGYQLNEEKSYYATLNPSVKIFRKLNNDYVRSRSEMAKDITSSGWWASTSSDPARAYRNMFALLASALYFGLDMSNQLGPSKDATGLTDLNNQLAYDFFNRNAGEKDPSEANNAFCLLRDGLDASNPRFDKFGVPYPDTSDSNYKLNMKRRFLSITGGTINNETFPSTEFAKRGARLEDLDHAIGGTIRNRNAKGINDVGYDIIEGNYERYITQIPAKSNGVPNPLYTSCDGWWNIIYPNDVSINNGGLSPYGRFAKSIKDQPGKTAMYFDIDNNFLSNYNGDLKITITYLDDGGNTYWLFNHWDALQQQTISEKSAAKKSLSPVWKQQVFKLPASGFTGANANKCLYGSDFFLQTKSTNGTTKEEDIFALIEINKTGNSSKAITSHNNDLSSLTLSTGKFSMAYPNPANDILHIKTSNETTFLLLNEEGKILLIKTINGIGEMNVSNLPTGIYYLKNEQTHETQKIMIER